MNIDDREMLSVMKKNEETIKFLVEDIKIRLNIKKGGKLPRFPNYRELLFKTSILENIKMDIAKKGDVEAIKYLDRVYALKIYTNEEIKLYKKGGF